MSAAPPGSPAPAAPRADAWDRVAGLVTLALALAWIAFLVPQALAARLMTDECFHAWVSRWIAQHHALPVRIAPLYGGFAYYYPPLYHLLGALAWSVAGVRGLLLANVAVCALLLLVVARGARALGAPAAARWAVALCVATPFLALHGVRMYVEALSTLLFARAALSLAALLGAGRIRTRDVVVLGVACGLATLAKLSGLVLPPLLLALALVQRAQGRRARAGALAWAAGIALAVGAPLLVRNAWLWGSPVYPAFGRDVNPLILRLNVRHFTPSPAALYLDMARCIGPAIGCFAAAAAAAAIARRRAAMELGLLAACAALVLAAPLQPLLQPRHLLPLIVAGGALAAVALERALADRPAARRMADVAALAFAAWGLATMPALRAAAGLDQPRELGGAYAAVRAFVPPGQTVLARETYDVLWYTGRPANWPEPFGQSDPPIEPFLPAGPAGGFAPDSVAARLARHGLRWVLLTDDRGPAVFDGAEWPQPFIDAMAECVRTGRAREVWRDGDLALVRIGP